jgi:predicted Zn-dependent peptidase
LLDFHARHFQPANFIVSAAGSFDTEELKSRLNHHLQKWPEPGLRSPAIPRPEFTPAPGVYVVDKSDVNQGRVGLGHLGTTRDNPDRFAIDLMNDILGGSGFTSRITNRVRSDEGLAYSAGSSYGFGTYYEGVFRASFQSKNRSCAQAAQIILDEIERIRREPVTEEEPRNRQDLRDRNLPPFLCFRVGRGRDICQR